MFAAGLPEKGRIATLLDILGELDIKMHPQTIPLPASDWLTRSVTSEM